jgi:uncharacterized membrane protein
MFDLDIDIPALFKYSFQLYKKYASFVIGIMITYFVLGIVPQIYISFYAPKNPTAQSDIVGIIVLAIRLVLTLGFTKVMFYLVADRQVEVSDLINNGRIFFSYVAAWFLYYVAVIIGLLLFIIPGIYVAIRLQFYPYYIIDEGDFAFEALRKSWYATEGYLPELIVFGACFLLVNFIGVVFIIGIIFTYPLCSMAQAVIYEGLSEGAGQLPTSQYLS